MWIQVSSPPLCNLPQAFTLKSISTHKYQQKDTLAVFLDCPVKIQCISNNIKGLQKNSYGLSLSLPHSHQPCPPANSVECPSQVVYTASDRVCVRVCFSCCNNLSVSFSCNTLNAHLKCNTLNAHLKCNTLMLQHFSYNTLSAYKFPPDDETLFSVALFSAKLSSGDHVCVKVSFS